MKKKTKYILYTLAGILIFVFLYALKNTSYFVRASTFMFSIIIFCFADSFFRLDFKRIHYLMFLIISTTGVLFSPLYFLYSNYDKILHLLNPILVCIIVFFLIDKIRGVSFSMKLFITFSIAISLLALFEIGEFALDKFFGFQLQGVYIRDISGISKLKIIMNENDDTMIDLLLGFVGTILFTIGKTCTYHYNKLKRKNKIKE